jgi:FixJ family two-component response regulator
VNPEEPIVFAIDDDPSVREALSRLFRSIGVRAQIFASAEDFVSFKRPDAPACLVLDVRLPGLSGLDLQRDQALLDAIDERGSQKSWAFLRRLIDSHLGVIEDSADTGVGLPTS